MRTMMMTKARLSREASALLPWGAAALVWFFLVIPMRAEDEGRLGQQSRFRRERLKSEQTLRETQSKQARVAAALSTACRVSADPSALRQRAVFASVGLGLSPFSLSVTGGPEAGAIIEAAGSRGTILQLLRRLGDPARGGFLRSLTLRDKGTRFGLSAASGVFGPFPPGVAAAPSSCPSLADPPPAETESTALQAQRPKPTPRLRASMPPSDDGAASLPPASIAPSPEPPFALIAFLRTDGKDQASIRVGGQVRMVSVGDQIEGWKCLSIDRDEGVVFDSAEKGRMVLRPNP